MQCRHSYHFSNFSSASHSLDFLVLFFFPTHFISHRWLSMDAMCFNNHSFFHAIIPFHWICGIDFGWSSCIITQCRRNKSILNFITDSSPWWLTMGIFFCKKYTIHREFYVFRWKCHILFKCACEFGVYGC